MITVDRCIKDEQINIVAMTEGAGLFHQTILCKSIPEDTYCILVPKIYPKSYFKKSLFGEKYQKEINLKYGSDLARFQNTYVAQVVKVYSVNNNPKLWYQICGELFKLWDPIEGPYEHLKQHISAGIVLFRVYNANEIVGKYVRNVNGRIPRLANDQVEIGIIDPVIDDVEFHRQKGVLEDILNKYN